MRTTVRTICTEAPNGFHTVIWDARPEETRSGARLTLSYTSRDGDAGYPGEVHVQVRYTLSESALRLDYTASAQEPTVVNLTNHAYFNLAGRGTIFDHVLRIRAARFLPVDEARIPRGEMADVRGTAFDFVEPAVIRERMSLDHEQFRIGRGYDHCWVLDEPHTLTAAAAELHEQKSGRTMRVFTTQPALQFYSGNFLDGTVVGKGGVRYPQYAGLCLETQHFPDSPNQPSFPTTRLASGEKYQHTTIYDFSTRPGRCDIRAKSAPVSTKPR